MLARQRCPTSDGTSLAGAADVGLAHYDALLLARPLEVIDLRGTEVDPAMWRDIPLDEARVLDVGQSSFSDAALLTVASRAPRLRSLSLRHTAITGAGLAAAAPRLTKLTDLDLEGTKLGESVTALAQLGDLETLDLRYVEVDDDGVRALRDLGRLRSLQLLHTALSCEAVREAAAGWVKLEHLAWMSAELDCDAGLARLPALRIVVVDGSGIHDAFLRDLGQCTALEHLSLSDTFATNEQLVRLRGLPSLRRVQTHGTRVTPSGCARLNKALGREVCGP